MLALYGKTVFSKHDLFHCFYTLVSGYCLNILANVNTAIHEMSYNKQLLYRGQVGLDMLIKWVYYLVLL